MGKHLKIFPAFIIMAVVIILDQASKILTRLHTEVGDSIILGGRIFGETFRFTHLRNTGAAFSLSFFDPTGNRIFLISVTLVAVVFIIYLLYNANHRIQVLSFGLVLGGAIGNVIDRILVGPVTDFMDVDFPNVFGLERWPVFNVADSAVFCGMVLLVIDMLFIRDKAVPEAKPETVPDDDDNLTKET
jgi:signal peptidase II